MKSLKFGVIMDDIATIKPYKDSTFAMLLEIQRRNWQIQYITLSDLYMVDEQVFARSCLLEIADNNDNWYSKGSEVNINLAELDVILMRKDPPFNMEYIYATYMLDHVQQNGTLVVNHPQALRDANEKMFTSHFPQCIPPMLISRNAKQIKDFVNHHQTAIIKPLGAMGGASIFKMNAGDANINVIIETLTQSGENYAMIQQFVPQISEGDKRILLIDGEPVPYALARIPTGDEFRGNIAAGGKGVGQPLSERDYWICQQIGETLKQKGLIFVGIDVIGDYLTEINVTSPTCIRELDKQFDLNISGLLMDAIVKRIEAQ
jgi:glutathione synthase